MGVRCQLPQGASAHYERAFIVLSPSIMRAWGKWMVFPSNLYGSCVSERSVHE